MDLAGGGDDAERKDSGTMTTIEALEQAKAPSEGAPVLWWRGRLYEVNVWHRDRVGECWGCGCSILDGHLYVDAPVSGHHHAGCAPGLWYRLVPVHTPMG